MLKCADNARVSEDGRYIVATKPGIPYVEKDGVGVMCAITIDGDIGSETGDITFGRPYGKWRCATRVQSICLGSLLIKGNLYGSATAAGSITVEGGINAPGEIVAAGEAVTARYCENSTVRAFGNVVVADAVMHSIVETEQALICSQDRGRIVGGLAIAKSGVSTYSAGSTMGIPTVFEIGVSPKLRKRYETLATSGVCPGGLC